MNNIYEKMNKASEAKEAKRAMLSKEYNDGGYTDGLVLL